MPTKKKASGGLPAQAGQETGRNTMQTEAFEATIVDYAAALELLRTGDFAAAKQRLLQIQATNPDEPELVERAGTYVRICDHRLAPPEDQPGTVDELYNRAVMLSNNGQTTEAIDLLTRALSDKPDSVECLYARSSAWALRGKADSAVADLRQAIALDAKIRFQAVNDPDFERIREEPVFIDIIEPTPTGA